MGDASLVLKLQFHELCHNPQIVELFCLNIVIKLRDYFNLTLFNLS